MANGTTSTTLPGMQKAEGAMTTAQATAKSGVSNVQGQLSALKSTWTGDSSVAFDGSMTTWINDCNIIGNKLGEMIEIMRGNRQVISAGEEVNEDIARNLPVGAGMAL